MDANILIYLSVLLLFSGMIALSVTVFLFKKDKIAEVIQEMKINKQKDMIYKRYKEEALKSAKKSENKSNSHQNETSGERETSLMMDSEKETALMCDSETETMLLSENKEIHDAETNILENTGNVIFSYSESEATDEDFVIESIESNREMEEIK